jgi:antitoxin VapB
MLNIKDPETDRLARRLANLTGESLTKAVQIAVRDRLEREERRRGRPSVEHLLAIARRCAARPVIDPRSPDEIIGYDERGLPR